MSDRTKLKQLLETEEGRVNHLYQDSRGFMTTAVGCRLPNIASALALQWNLKSGAPAAQSDIVADWIAVKKLVKGMTADRYGSICKCHMEDEVIDTLLDQNITTAETHLSPMFSGWANFPDPVQDALLDMAFNLGVLGLLKGFPHMIAAVKCGDWATCAAQCQRSAPVSEARNQATRQLFLSA